MSDLANRSIGAQRSSNQIGDSVGLQVVFISLHSVSEIIEGHRVGHALFARQDSSRIGSKVPRFSRGRCHQFQVTTGDNGDSVGCPPLTTFDPIKCGQTSSNVDSDAVTIVTTLSPKTSDSVGAISWGPLSGFARGNSGQRSSNQNRRQFGDLCPESNRDQADQNGHSITTRKRRCHHCHYYPPCLAGAVTTPRAHKKLFSGLLLPFLVVDFPRSRRFHGNSRRKTETPHELVTASLGTFNTPLYDKRPHMMLCPIRDVPIRAVWPEAHALPKRACEPPTPSGSCRTSNPIQTATTP